MQAVTHTEARREIGDAVRKRTDVVVSGWPASVAALVGELRCRCVAFLDVGEHAPVTRTDIGALVELRAGGLPGFLGTEPPAIVALVRKADLAELRRVLGNAVPADGSRDVILLEDPETGLRTVAALLAEVLDQVSAPAC